MKRNIYLLLTTILSLMNLCCADASQRLVEDSTKQATTMKVDSIKVRVPGKVSIIDDDLLMVIDDKEKIDKIVRIFDAQVQEKASWRPEWDGHSFAPRPFLQLKFYKGNEIVGGFGIASEPAFFSISDPELGYRIKYVERAKIIEVIELIGLNEEEWRKLVRQWDQPGPWKKQ